MSLVAYGDSDCESDEDDCVTAEVNKPSSNSVQEETKTVLAKSFLSLPQPKHDGNLKILDSCEPVEEKIPPIQSKQPVVTSIPEKKENYSLFPTLPKPKTGGKVKITIPSLNEVLIIIFEKLKKVITPNLIIPFVFLVL